MMFKESFFEEDIFEFIFEGKIRTSKIKEIGVGGWKRASEMQGLVLAMTEIRNSMDRRSQESLHVLIHSIQICLR